ncbi:hypothetical protein DUI87_15205 [Hirundo rustica rustica]|uniref:Uncharacterized protein n=1 Tax=Hirundo rustica rustica TaxID=333673 RepID=A0A3M0K6K9_HIRRU|nr:hypothetical protein DUI87_15205 [Hirundo rustica rustica]
MDLLLQEKMAHVEELRLIHADIMWAGYVVIISCCTERIDNQAYCGYDFTCSHSDTTPAAPQKNSYSC